MGPLGLPGGARPDGMLPDGGRRLIEPPGYSITSFLLGGAVVAGAGLAPVGLLLIGAVVPLTIIEWRRLRAANPWFTFDDEADLQTLEGTIVTRLSLWSVPCYAVLIAVAALLVSTTGDRGAALGPAVVGGFAALWFNALLRRRLARPPAPGDTTPRMGEPRPSLADAGLPEPVSDDDADEDGHVERPDGDGGHRG